MSYTDQDPTIHLSNETSCFSSWAIHTSKLNPELMISSPVSQRETVPITLQRFRSVCQNIETDLRTVSLECRRKHPELKALAERGVLRIGDYRDRREFVYRAGGNQGDQQLSSSSLSQECSVTKGLSQFESVTSTEDIHTPTPWEFPTWDLVAVVAAINQSPSSTINGVLLQKALLLALSAIHRLLGLWQQQQQSNVMKRFSTITLTKDTQHYQIYATTFDYDIFCTHEQIEVILKLLFEYSGMMSHISVCHNQTIECLGESMIAYRNTQMHYLMTHQQHIMGLTDLEMIQLKILQIILSLLSVGTPLFCSSTYMLDNTFINVCDMKDIIHNKSDEYTDSLIRAQKLICLLGGFYLFSSSPNVKHTALAGLSQFVQFLIDSCATLLYVALERSNLINDHCISLLWDTLQMTPLEYSFFFVTHHVLYHLSSIAGGYDDNRLNQTTTLHVEHLIDSELSVDLLISAFGSCPIYLMHCPLFKKGLIASIENVLVSCLTNQTIQYSLCLRVLRLAQTYWLNLPILLFNKQFIQIHHQQKNEMIQHLVHRNDMPFNFYHTAQLSEDNDVNCDEPIPTFHIRLVEMISQLFDSNELLWKQFIGLLCCRWILFQQETIRYIPLIILNKLIGQLSKYINEACFIGGQIHHPILSKMLSKCIMSNHIPFSCPILRLTHERYQQLYDDLSQLFYDHSKELDQQQQDMIIQQSVHHMKQPMSYEGFVDSTVIFSESYPLFDDLFYRIDLEHLQNDYLLSSQGDNDTTKNDNVSHKSSQDHHLSILHIAIEALVGIISTLSQTVYDSTGSSIRIIDDIQQMTYDITYLPTIAVSSTGLVLYIGVQFPLTRELSFLKSIVDLIWGPVLSALSVVLTSTNHPIKLIETCIHCLLSLFSLLSAFKINPGLQSTLRTMIKIISGTYFNTHSIDNGIIHSKTNASLIEHNSSFNHSFIKNNQKYDSIIHHKSASLIGADTFETSHQHHVSTINCGLTLKQSLYWKCLLCAVRNFGTNLSSDNWNILLPALYSLYRMILITTDSNQSEKPIYGTTYRVGASLDFALLDHIGTTIIPDTPLQRSPSKRQDHSTMIPTNGIIQHNTGVLLILETGLMSIFDRSSLFFLSTESVMHLLLKLGGFMTMKDTENELPLDHFNSTIICRFENGKAHVNVEEGVLCRVVAWMYDLEKYTNDSLIETTCVTQNETLVNGMTFSSSESKLSQLSPLDAIETFSFFCLKQFIHVILKNVDRLASPQAVEAVCRLLGHACLIETNPGSSKEHQIQCEQFQLEAVNGLSNVSWKLIEATWKDNTDTAVVFVGDDTGLCQGLILGELCDVFVKTKLMSIKRLIVETFFTILTASGSKLTGPLSWTIVCIFIGVCTKQCFNNVIPNDKHPDIKMSFIYHLGVAQDNLLFKLLEVLVHEFCDQILEPSAIALLATSSAKLATSTIFSDNVSFTAVGLLWTLAESLSHRRISYGTYEHLDDNTSRMAETLSYRQQSRTARVTIWDDALLVPLERLICHHNITDLDHVIICIFEEFRRLASDSRVEVRNCSLRSLSSAYLTTVVNCQESYEFKDGVGLILIRALEDLTQTYISLNCVSTPLALNDKSYQDPPVCLQHHSRDTNLKLWDESLSIILDGVSSVILHISQEMQSTVIPRVPALELFSHSVNSTATLLQYLIDVSFQPTQSSKKILLDVTVTAVRILTRLCNISFTYDQLDTHNNDNTIDHPFWNILSTLSVYLWNIGGIPTRITDVFMSFLEELGSRLFTENITTHDIYKCIISVRLLLIVMTAFPRSLKDIQLPLEKNIITNNVINQVLNQPDIHHIDQSHYTTPKLINHPHINAHTELSIESFIQTFDNQFWDLETILNDDIFNQCIPDIYVPLSNTFNVLLPAYNDWVTRWNTLSSLSSDDPHQDHPGLIQSEYLLQDLFTHKEQISQSSTDRDNSPHPWILSFTPIIPAESKHSTVFGRQPLKYSRPIEKQNVDHSFDDDYVVRPNWLPSYCQINRYKLLNTTSQFIEPINENELSSCTEKSIQIIRTNSINKRLHSTEILCIEVLEGFIPWDLLLLYSPIIWLKLIDQILSALLSVDRVYSFVSTVLLASRAMNALTRIFRKSFLSLCLFKHNSYTCFQAVGAGLFLVSARIFSLLRKRTDLISLGFRRFAFESLLQLAVDSGKFAAVASLHIDPTYMTTTYGSICIILNAFRRSWGPGMIRIKSSPSNYSTGDALDSLLLYAVRCFLGLEKAFDLNPSILPNELFHVLLGLLNEFNGIGGRYGLLELSQTSLETMFDLCETLSFHSTLTKHTCNRLEEAVHMLCGRLRILLTRFIVDDTQSGQCPLPRQRLEEIIFVLVRLRSLKLPPSGIERQQSLFPFNAPSTEITLDTTTHKKVEKLRAEDKNHIFLLLPELINLIPAKDGTVRKELKAVLEQIVANCYSSI